MRESVKFLESTLATDIATLGTETILNCAKTSMSSKIVGADADFFGKMVVNAVMAVKTYNDYGDPRYPIKSINVLKAHGKSVKESRVINGYALNLGRAAQGMVKSVKNAKVACIDFNLQKTKMQMGVQVLVTDPRELERIRQEELNITARRVKMMIDAGANVILCSKGIDDMALKYFVEAGAEFAEALLVIPKVLSVNAAKDSTELVAKLRAYHHAAQTKPEKKHLAGYGLDLVKGELKDNLNEGVLEPMLSKVKSIQFATEAAITILRIDDLIKLHPEEGQQGM